MVNPSGFESISNILQNLGRRAWIKSYVEDGKRAWVYLENDGGIYTIVARLLKNNFRCTQCKCCFYGEDNLRSHSCFSMNTEILLRREFDWIIPMPGLLHIEMNAAKAFMTGMFSCKI